MKQAANDNRAPNPDAVTVWAVPYKPSMYEITEALQEMQHEGIEHKIKEDFMFVWSLSRDTAQILKEQLAPLRKLIARLSVDEQYIQSELR